MAKLSKRDMAGYLGVDVSTLHNWRKKKPNLYRIIIKGFCFDEVLESSKVAYKNLRKIDDEINSEIDRFAGKGENGKIDSRKSQ